VASSVVLRPEKVWDGPNAATGDDAVARDHSDPRRKGLRERLAIETATFPAADHKRIAQALDLAARLRVGDPLS
jgi:hypothetical protein